MAVNERCDRLSILLSEAGMAVACPPPAPRMRDLPRLGDQILHLYRELGGIQEHPTLAPRGWDILAGGVLVELDEEQHFNRYRALTLEPAWAAALPWAEAYRPYCTTGEPTSLSTKTGGRFWVNPGSRAQFGAGAPPRDLDHPQGSPRWKQRALYDAMRDAYAAEGHHPVARVSVYDTLTDGTTLEALTRGTTHTSPTLLRQLIDSRTARATTAQ